MFAHFDNFLIDFSSEYVKNALKRRSLLKHKNYCLKARGSGYEI